MEHSAGGRRTPQRGTSTFCLSLHADYACRHSGACCTAGWTIPIEPPAFERVSLYLDDHARSALHFITTSDVPAGAAAIVGVRPDGACMFFESERGRLCAIHRDIGPDALPSACRQFPRVVLQDERGTLIAFSHFCPTAAALLRSPSPLAIVAAPRNVDLDGAVDGLDARGTLPPLLYPWMLADHECYAAWESRAVALLDRDDLTASQAVATLAAIARTLEAWRPGGTSLADAVARAFDTAAIGDTADDADEDLRRVRLVRSAVPAGLTVPPGFDDGIDRDRFRDRWPHTAPIVRAFDRVVRTYLAARLFGNWVAYHGRGLQSVVEYLRICHAVLTVEAARHSACSSVSSPWQTVIEPAIRSADLLLVHLADTNELANRLP
jgi:Fe-S-cluster containining protein